MSIRCACTGMLIGVAAMCAAPRLAEAQSDTQVRRRPRPIVEFFERLREQRLAREAAQDPEERKAKAERAFAAMKLLLKQVIDDQKLTDDQTTLQEQYLADPLAQEIYQVLSARKAEDFEFDEEQITELLELARPQLGVKDDEEWNGVVAGVITKLRELPEFTADRDVNQILGVMFDTLATTLGEGKELSQVQSVTLGLTFRQFLQSKKNESLKLMKESLAESKKIHKSGRDPKAALAEMRAEEKD